MERRFEAGLIQRAPMGLLDFLALKSSGDNPQLFPATLQAVSDVTDLYLANRWQYVSETLAAAVGAPGQFGFSLATSMVPAQELWIVDGAGLTTTANVAAATSYRVRLAVHETTAATLQRLSDASSAAAGERPFCAINDRFVMRPNDRFAVACEAVTLGAIATFQLTFRVAKLVI